MCQSNLRLSSFTETWQTKQKVFFSLQYPRDERFIQYTEFKTFLWLNIALGQENFIQLNVLRDLLFERTGDPIIPV